MERLVAHIRENGLQPGDNLPSEGKLAEQYGVSRPVVREAMKALAGQGIVEIASGKRAVVKPVNGAMLRGFFSSIVRLDHETLRQVMEVRRALEVEGVRLAHGRISVKQHSELAAIVQQMGDTLHDYDRFMELDWQFHLLLARSTQNKMLFFLLESIRDSVKSAIREGLLLRRSPEELEAVQAIHQKIVTALQQEKDRAVVRAMIHHFDMATAIINERSTPEKGDNRDE